MRRGARAEAERARQADERRRLLTVIGAGCAGAMLVVAGVWHRRAHLTAQRAADTAGGEAGWAARALGLGTLYAVGASGLAAAAVSHYLHQQGVSSPAGFGEHMRRRTAEILGRPVRERQNVNSDEDRRMLELADRWLYDVDEESGKRKLSLRRLTERAQQQDDAQESPADGEALQRMSLGARMRAACGFGPKRHD